MLEQVKKYITSRNRTVYSKRNIEYIVIHYVGATSSALANAKYFKTTYRGASAHYFVDEKDIYQVVEDKDAAWHCGAAHYKHLRCRNSNSIGIEMCCYKNSKGKLDVSENIVNRTIELTKDLMKKYNIPADHVIRHYDVTGKNCPAPMVENPSRWTKFVEKIQAKKSIIEKIFTSGSNFKAGEKVLINVPVVVAYDNGGEKLLVDSNGYQFWIHRSVVNDGKIYGLGQVCFAQGDGLNIVQIFDDQFWCRDQYMSRNF